MDAEIREALLSDLDAINDLFREGDAVYSDRHPEMFEPISEPPRDHDWLKAVLGSGTENLLLTEIDDRVVGLVHGIVNSIERRGLRRRKTGHIDSVLVAESFRNRGIGTQLISAIEDWFRAQGVEETDLGVWIFNTDAMRLYQRLGYEAFHIRMRKYPFEP